MHSDVQAAVVRLASQGIPPQQIIALFKGIASNASIYKWIKNSKDTDILPLKFDEKQLVREREFYISAPGRYDARPRDNKIVLHHQPHYYAAERELWKDSEIRDKLITNRKQYLFKDQFTNAELLRGFKISGIHTGYSHFSPLWIRKFVNEFGSKSIYDPCGGWGHRLIGAQFVNYHYNDLWDQSCTGAEKISKFINADHIKITNNDCTVIETTNDTCFTCPPYFNTEVYSNSFRDYDDYKEFIKLMYHKNKAPLWGIVINNKFEQLIIDSFCSHTLVRKQPLGKSYSHFTQQTKGNTESLLIFKQ